MYRLLPIVFFFNCYLTAQSQVIPDSLVSKQVVGKYSASVSKQSEQLADKLDRKSKRVLSKLSTQEGHLYRKLSKIDSLTANVIFSSSTEKYKRLQERLTNPGILSQYIPRIDTLVTSFKFLEQNQQWLNETKDAKEKLNHALSNVKDMESQLQKAADIKQFLKERRQFLNEQLEKFGFAKDLKKINKEVYYYSQQINEYKTILKDPKKIEKRAIELLSKTKLFQDFMKKNSLLASLFRMPGDPNDPNYIASLAGLQTRAQVNSLIQNQIAAGGPNGRQAFQQNLQQAQSQLQQLKDKVNKRGGGSSDDIMPEGFKPNNQRTKSFWKRIELGTNVQSQKASNLFPITSDLALSAGYKLNDKSIIGFGTSYKMGWGKGWNNINITHQGVGIRSFIDWRLKGSFWISGGYEQNYKAQIRSIDQLRNQSAWQQSGLIGISKTVSIKSKLFKKTKVQLLWDFLSYQQVPRAQPVLIRVGYNF